MKHFILFPALLVIGMVSFAQAPPGINYQAVALSAGGLPLAGRTIAGVSGIGYMTMLGYLKNR